MDRRPHGIATLLILLVGIACGVGISRAMEAQPAFAQSIGGSYQVSGVSLEARVSMLERAVIALNSRLNTVERRQYDHADKPQSDGGRRYAGVGAGHWVKEKSPAGKTILLEDGSWWEISTVSRTKTVLWPPMTKITVLESEGAYPYKLVKTDDGETAEAKYLGEREGDEIPLSE